MFGRFFVAVSLMCATPAFAQVIHHVPPGGNLQTALNAAQPGDTITLAPGAIYSGNFVLPAKSGDQFITIRSAADDSTLPAANERVTPATAALLPKLRSPNTMSVLRTAAGAHHYRLLHLELFTNVSGTGTILALGDGSSAQNSLATVPHSLEVDRVYIHGDPVLGAKRGIALNSASTRIVNSYIADIKAVGQDSQAIGGWNGPGPYFISNNYLEGAGENVMFGGSDPAINGLVPSDITFTHNHVKKPLSWRGTTWTIKNLFELKSAQRVVIDQNVFENNWAAAQTGSAILLKSVNQDGGAPWSVVQDVQFTNNIVRNVSSAVNILGRDARYPALEANNIVLRNNLFANVSGSAFGGNGRLLLINGGSTIVFDHNTVINDGTSTIFADGEPVAGFVFTNNVIFDNGLGIKASGVAEGTATLAAFFPGSVVTGNVIAKANAGLYPSGNFYPSLTDVGFIDYASANYQLAESSLYKGAAANGRDPGFDFTQVVLPVDVGDDTANETIVVPAGPAPVPPAQEPAPNTPPPSGPSIPDAPSSGAAAPTAPPVSRASAGASGSSGSTTLPAASAESQHVPHNVTANVTGSTVALSWNAPTSTTVREYLVEAGSAPGAANIARLATGNQTTGLIAQGVPDGRYYVRIRAITPTGAGEPSSDTSFIVGHVAGCATAPAAPVSLTARVQGATVTLTWGNGNPACAPTHYVVQAGSAPGLGNLAQIAIGGATLVTNAPAGVYYVRVLAANAAGVSAASNEVVVTVP